MKYIKKQEKIEAVQVRKDNFEEIEEFVGDAEITFRLKKYIGRALHCTVMIRKNGDVLCACENDYIVKCNDELSTCKKELFEREYRSQQTDTVGEEQDDKVTNIMADLVTWVTENYDPFCCGWTAARSFGNSAGVFNDGALYARSWDAYNIAMILGMGIAEPVTEWEIKRGEE